MVEQRTENPLRSTKVLGLPGKGRLTVRESERAKLARLLAMGKSKEEILEAMKPRRANGNGHDVPEGGITLMNASRKYKIPPATLSDWLHRGWVKLIKQSGKYKYLREADITKLAPVDRRAGHSTLAKVSK